MNVGVSTANLYPMRTEDAFKALLEAGFRTIEVFLNTESEATAEFAAKLKRMAGDYGARIPALHSYNSSCEAFLLFSNYQRRLEDGLKRLDEVFRSAEIVGAPYVIMHGDRPGGPLSVRESVLRYEVFYDLGRTRNVTLLLENVAYYRSAELSYIEEMRRLLGEKAQFVFDLKQSVRCGIIPNRVISAMGAGIRHVHISDNDAERDCIIPGKGRMNYAGLLRKLKEYGFDGDLIIELYRSNFKEIGELVEAKKELNRIIGAL
ncbi:MAG TPA: sugar phosphate isomerase/epimerase [Candidatus Avimonas sp.]|jgi:sugar phosphate isomerase/epimerase|nr:sugar phosphate isomerase/epimerase [Clostridiales bacterium]HOB37226.1 sugar phosphate isomerase/epimerase [Candidatus Avimonas sp.]HQA16605.1 sugar phosphate isomerase/epimerase [Candidatus Avimonas sp.]HQD38696.1 sugar phosphate isomerase/epimerase [Candidatus Avimonas sp.]